MGSYFNIRKFHKLPLYIQWIQAVLLAAAGFFFCLLFIINVEFPIQILLLPLLKPVGHFCLAPMLKLVGILNYQSPMLLIFKNSSTEFEIHNGNTFDYFTQMKWKHKGRIAKNRMMKYYLEGLLSIISKIEMGQFPKESKFIGISYFFSRHTANKIGFKFDRVKLIHRFLFLIDYINLFLMYSFSQGSLAFPSLFQLKKVKISAEDLLNSKDKIITLQKLLERKNKFGTV